MKYILSFLCVASLIYSSEQTNTALKNTDVFEENQTYLYCYASRLCEICGTQAQTIKINDGALRFFCLMHYPVIEEK